MESLQYKVKCKISMDNSHGQSTELKLQSFISKTNHASIIIGSRHFQSFRYYPVNYGSITTFIASGECSAVSKASLILSRGKARVTAFWALMAPVRINSIDCRCISPFPRVPQGFRMAIPPFPVMDEFGLSGCCRLGLNRKALS